MAVIPQLVALSALAYAVILIFVILLLRAPRPVDLSARLYRLLIAAYPAGFRQEYGDAMAQLFRDTARDGYRRRGLFGLSAVCGHAMADLVANVFRQHRQERTAAISEEALSGKHLLRRWLFLGGPGITVTMLSATYAVSLVRRRPLWTWAIISAIILGFWCWSFFEALGRFSLSQGTDLDIRNGSMELRHVYEQAEPIAPNRWLSNENAIRSRSPSAAPRPWEVSFSSGNVTGGGGGAALIRPSFYWQLRIPLAFVPVLLLCLYLLTRSRSHSLTATNLQ